MDWLLLYEMLKPLGTRLPNLIDSIQPKHNAIPAQLKNNNQKKKQPKSQALLKIMLKFMLKTIKYINAYKHI